MRSPSSTLYSREHHRRPASEHATPKTARDDASGWRRPSDHWKCTRLRERGSALDAARAFRGSRLRRDLPEIYAAAIHCQLLVGCPRPHAERVRDHARSRLQFVDELWLQLQVERLEQVERHDRRWPEVRLEEVRLDELHAIAHPGFFRVGGRFLDAFGIDVDADAPRAVRLGGFDHNASVATAEVIHEILARDRRRL